MPSQFQVIRSVFNGGEMSPIMDGRTDSPQYATGCRILENFIARSYGGVFKRPGTRYGLSSADTADLVRLLPFRRSTDINFVLAFKTNAIKIFSYSAGTFTLVTTIVTTYSEAEIQALHYCQLNDVMFLTCSTEIPKRLTRNSDGTWTFESVPFQFAPALDPPDDAVTLTLVYGADEWISGAANVVGDYVLYLNELYRCKTANSDVAFTIAKWDKAVYRTPWNVGQSYVAGDVVEYFGSNYFCLTANTSSTANRPGVGAQWELLPLLDYKLFSSSPVFDSSEIGSIWLLSPGSSKRVTSEAVPVAIGTTTSAAIFIQGSYTARTNWSSGGAPSMTTFQLQESLDRINFTTIKEWYINGLQEGTILHTADAPNTGGWYRMIAIRDSNSGGTGTTMTIEPAVGKLDIPFLIESDLTTSKVRGLPRLAVDSLIPNEVIGTAFPVWRKGAFSPTRGFPRTVCFHDSRLWFASTSTEPMRMWGSQVDDFYTFLTGSLDTAGIDLTLAATQANDIQSITSFKRTMVIMTTGEEWTLDSGEQDGALTPSNVRLRRWSRYGSSYHQPILAGDGLLWLTRDNRLREFAYVFEKDGYSAPEMTLLAEHVPSSSPVIQIGYSQSPDPIVWLVHENGRWSGFTYDRENSVTAWHRHASGVEGYTADCLSLCTLYDADGAGADTMVYLFERQFASNAILESVAGNVMQAAMTSANPSWDGVDIDDTPMVFMDCHVGPKDIDASGGGFSIFNAINLLNPAFVNGAVLTAATADGVYAQDGSGNAASAALATVGGIANSLRIADGLGSLVTVNIGVPYVAVAIPNRMEVPLQSGSAQMRRWRITRICFRVFKSLYGNFQAQPAYANNYGSVTSAASTAIDYTDMDEFPRTLFPNDVSNVIVKTGQTLPQAANFDWDCTANLVISSAQPGPFNLLSVLMEVEIGDTSGAGGS